MRYDLQNVKTNYHKRTRKGMKEDQNHGYLKIKEVAEKLRCSPGTVRNMVRDGRLSAYTPTKTWLFSAEEVERLVQSTKVPE